MTDKLKIDEIVFHIDSEGKFARAEELARKALDAAGIHAADDGGSMFMHPIEDGSEVIRVAFSDLEMDVE